MKGDFPVGVCSALQLALEFHRLRSRCGGVTWGGLGWDLVGV